MDFFMGLVLLFIGLKLTHYIDWSWWLVLSPFIVKVVIIMILDFLDYIGK